MKSSGLKNEMVKKGQIVEATEKFFASNAKTIDFDGTKVNQYLIITPRSNQYV